MRKIAHKEPLDQLNQQYYRSVQYPLPMADIQEVYLY